MSRAAPKPRPKTKPPQGRRGAPSKKTALAMERALRIAKTGLPIKFCAIAASVTAEGLLQWRKSDAVFNEAFEQARLEAVEKRWETIRKASEKGLPGSWMAASWMLERSNPSEFCTPAVALGVQVNQTNVVNNNSLTVSMEVDEKLQARSKAIDAEIDKASAEFLARRSLTNGTSRGPVREVEAELISSGTISLPPPISRHVNWWNSLSKGDGHRLIEPEAAEFIVRAICVDALGGAKAASLKIAMDAGTLTLHDVWSALESLCGPAGWQQLCRRGEA